MSPPDGDRVESQPEFDEGREWWERASGQQRADGGQATATGNAGSDGPRNVERVAVAAGDRPAPGLRAAGRGAVADGAGSAACSVSSSWSSLASLITVIASVLSTIVSHGGVATGLHRRARGRGRAC